MKKLIVTLAFLSMFLVSCVCTQCPRVDTVIMLESGMMVDIPKGYLN